MILSWWNRASSSSPQLTRAWILFVIIAVLLLLHILFHIAVLVFDTVRGIYQYGFMRELNLTQRYGERSWVIITGASSGQGRRFAIEWASRGFSLLLIGSKRTEYVVTSLRTVYPGIHVEWILKDFGQAFRDDFFDDIDATIDRLCRDHVTNVTNVSVLINSVGQRLAWKPFHESDPKRIRDTIATGTMVQARMIHMMIPRMLHRTQMLSKRCLILSITAQCLYKNFGFGAAQPQSITVPYLTVYEPTNAWGFFNMNSIALEYGNQLDLLNVTPGAVCTDTTRSALERLPCSISDTRFVKNLFCFMGQVQGETCGYWAHAAGIPLSNMLPWVRRPVLDMAGESLAQYYMKSETKQY